MFFPLPGIKQNATKNVRVGLQILLVWYGAAHTVRGEVISDNIVQYLQFFGGVYGNKCLNVAGLITTRMYAFYAVLAHFNLFLSAEVP